MAAETTPKAGPHPLPLSKRRGVNVRRRGVAADSGHAGEQDSCTWFS
ncbi:MAG TPA: hypothetical protein VJY62_11085 [Bacteroidia bacterium]|nr:hypothetical protein [Bacteroidia bacterium]